MADQGSARSIFVGRWVRVLPVCRVRSLRMDVRPPEALQMAFGRANRIPLSIRRLRAPGRRHSGTRRHRMNRFAIEFTTDEAAPTREVARRPPPVDHRRDQGRRDADLGGG